MGCVRPISEDDIDQVIHLYRSVYGDTFPYREIYDPSWIRRGIYSDDVLWHVAESCAGTLIGSSALMMSVGRQENLVGEFGRLVVHPDARRKGIGSELCKSLVEHAKPQIDFGFAECRTTHLGAQRIFSRMGFCPVGIEPMAYRLLNRRETVVTFCRLFGNARTLRRNNPRVIEEVRRIGSLALALSDLEDDLLVERAEQGFPIEDEKAFSLVPLEDREVYRLLRLTRANLLEPAVFGGFCLEQGYLRARSLAGEYLALRQDDALLGGVGFTWDEGDAKARIFELISATQDTIGILLALTLKYIMSNHTCDYIQIDVSAHAARMQRTLVDFGFSPVAYFPSMVFHAGERLDVVRMAKLGVSAAFDDVQILGSAMPLFSVVRDSIQERAEETKLSRVTRRAPLFMGLSDIQLDLIARICSKMRYEAHQWVFRAGDKSRGLFFVLDGSVEIVLHGQSDSLGTVWPGEHFGEMALIDGLPQCAGAVCREPTCLIVLPAERLIELCQRERSLGMQVYRNLATELCHKLRNADEMLLHRISSAMGALSGAYQVGLT